MTGIITKFPNDYASLGFKTLLISHHPVSSPAAPSLPLQAITVVTLNRPTRLNAFSYELAYELEAVFEIMSNDDRIRCIVLTGAGRAFCAGADLGEGMLTSDLPVDQHRDEGGRVSLSIFRCKKPVIAAINGPAVGVGITMTLACTIRLTHKAAKIAFPFVGRGLVPEAVSSFFLPKLIGHSKAMHILTTGETLLSGDRLVEGLFSEVLEAPGMVLPRALGIAETIATKASAASVYLVKAMLWRTPPTPEETHLLDSRLLAELYRGLDTKEGILAFLEKRDPVFASGTENLPSVVPWWDTRKTAVPEAKRWKGKI